MARAIAVRRIEKASSEERKEARTRLRTAFLDALAADYEAHGAAAIAAVRIDRPHDYVKLVAALMPKSLAEEEGDQGAVPVFVDVCFVSPEG